MRNKSYYLFVFHSTHNAMEAQKILAVCNPIIMPTLRKIAATCGISIRIEEDKIEEAKTVIGQSSLDKDMVDLYYVDQTNKEEMVSKIKLEKNLY